MHISHYVAEKPGDPFYQKLVDTFPAFFQPEEATGKHVLAP